MKFKATYKNPDALHYALHDAGFRGNDLPEEVDKVVTKFTHGYGEYVTIEFDTETQTARVVER